MQNCEIAADGVATGNASTTGRRCQRRERSSETANKGAPGPGEGPPQMLVRGQVVRKRGTADL